MPVETIKCQECGSAEVTEFKPGSYVCGHCEAVFKHVSSVVTAGGCEIDGCGVPAVGRCHMCGQRFCGTHQAKEGWGGGEYGRRFTDFCSVCHAAEAAGARQQAVDRSRKLEELRSALPSEAEPLEIVRLLAGIVEMGVMGEEVVNPTSWRPAWARLVASGALKRAEWDVVHVRFHKRPIGRAGIAVLSRRPGWHVKAEGHQWWLCDDGALWSDSSRAETKMYRADETPEGTFVLSSNQKAELETETRKIPPSSEFNQVLGERRRYWSVAQGTALKDMSNYVGAIRVVARIAAAAFTA